MNCELISLDRLMRVLVDYRAHEAELGTDAREAIEQLHRLCKYAPGVKVLAKENAQRNTWSKGVVIAYMLHAPHFVIGPGDDREKRYPEDTPIFGMHQKDLRPRSSVPEGGKIVLWASGRKRGRHDK